MHCAHHQVNEVQATVGFSLEKFTYGTFDFTIADMAGASKFRNLWEKIYSEVQGVIFVIDSCDEFCMVGVKYELEQMLQHDAIAKDASIPILFFANKMDLPKALGAAEISERLTLPALLAARQFNIVRSNALTGAGLDGGMKWLTDHLNVPEADE